MPSRLSPNVDPTPEPSAMLGESRRGRPDELAHLFELLEIQRERYLSLCQHLQVEPRPWTIFQEN